MPTLNSNTGPISILNKREDIIATADKVVYNPIKGKGEPFPKSATVVLHGVEGIKADEKIPVFDVLSIEDDGVVQKRTRILNCEMQGWIEGKLVAIATASDVSVQK